MKIFILLSFSFLVFGCISDEDKIIGNWETNLFIINNVDFRKASFNFDSDNTLAWQDYRGKWSIGEQKKEIILDINLNQGKILIINGNYKFVDSKLKINGKAWIKGGVINDASTYLELEKKGK
ncbi:MAG: hypothetical protein JJE09_00055 [Bacteroidia bacterium]|nr:hypothetical protein [Bacteroidia bacterium]